MVGDELVLRGGKDVSDSKTTFIKDGYGRILFKVVNKDDGSISILDPNGNEYGGGSDLPEVPSTSPEAGYVWTLSYNTTSDEYEWVQVPTTQSSGGGTQWVKITYHNVQKEYNDCEESNRFVSLGDITIILPTLSGHTFSASDFEFDGVTGNLKLVTHIGSNDVGKSMIVSYIPSYNVASRYGYLSTAGQVITEYAGESSDGFEYYLYLPKPSNNTNIAVTVPSIGAIYVQMVYDSCTIENL